MKFNVYLPDELGERAKKEDLKLSRMLRGAVIANLAQRDAMADTLSETSTYEVELLAANEFAGERLPYVGRIKGREIANVADMVRVFLTDDRRVIAYNAEMQEYERLDEPPDRLAENLSVWLPEPADYINACQALGIKPVIDL